MNRVIKIIFIILFAVFILAQFIRPSFTNPPIVQSETLQSAMPVPENVQAILSRSCNDCHSNETIYPWYAKIQPGAWFLDEHIKEGRNELNFSIWDTYQPDKKKRKLEEICEQIESRAMPLPSYLWIHRDAGLTEDEIKTMCDWTKIEINKIETQ